MSLDPGRLARAAAEWAVTHRVDAGGWQVRYRDAGKGPPLVLVHGLGCSVDYWVRNGAWLAAAGYRVLAPDLPGFGRTDGPRAGLTIIQQAYAISVFAEAMGLGPAAYLGHSLSCQTVLELACTEPDRVSALILAAPTGDRRRKRLLREAVGFLRDIPREPRLSCRSCWMRTCGPGPSGGRVRGSPASATTRSTPRGASGRPR